MKTLSLTVSRRLLGSELSRQDQARVLAAYTHRFTRDHKPQWTARPDCAKCPVQFDSDADWLAHTSFAVRKDGSLDNRNRFSESCPTWPDNSELRRKSA